MDRFSGWKDFGEQAIVSIRSEIRRRKEARLLKRTGFLGSEKLPSRPPGYQPEPLDSKRPGSGGCRTAIDVGGRRYSVQSGSQPRLVRASSGGVRPSAQISISRNGATRVAGRSAGFRAGVASRHISRFFHSFLPSLFATTPDSVVTKDRPFPRLHGAGGAVVHDCGGRPRYGFGVWIAICSLTGRSVRTAIPSRPSGFPSKLTSPARDTKCSRWTTSFSTGSR